jgi:hypothetical protein
MNGWKIIKLFNLNHIIKGANQTNIFLKLNEINVNDENINK